jgi:hypothetical protein
MGVRLINAHVIPRSFFTIVRGEGKYAVQMRAGAGSVQTPYHQAGVADPEMLCEECEPKFGEWDTYGFEVFSLRHGEEKAVRSREGVPIVIPIDDLKYELLILFLLSVLWRASVCNIDFFKGIALGPYEDQIHGLLWRRESPPASEFSVIMGTSLNQRYPNVILAPERHRLEGILFNTLYLPNLFIHLKTDRRNAPEVMQLGMLQPRKTNYIWCYPYDRTPYPRFFDGMKREIRKIERLKGR